MPPSRSMDAVISCRECSQRTLTLSASAGAASVYLIAAQSVQSASLIPQQLELRRSDAINPMATLYGRLDFLDDRPWGSPTAQTGCPDIGQYDEFSLCEPELPSFPPTRGHPMLCTLGEATGSIRAGTAAKRECDIRRQAGYDLIHSWHRSLPARLAPSGPVDRTRGLPAPGAPSRSPCSGSGVAEERYESQARTPGCVG
jgi:hypothetical protein